MIYFVDQVHGHGGTLGLRVHGLQIALWPQTANLLTDQLRIEIHENRYQGTHQQQCHADIEDSHIGRILQNGF